MGYLTASFEDLDQHAMEQLVIETNELSPILRGHIFIEKTLETLISRNLEIPQAFFSRNRGFDLKLDLARAMGLLSEAYYLSLKALNSIRNSYSHQAAYKVSFEELNSLKFGWEPIQKEAYAKACQKGIDEAARVAMIFLCGRLLTWLAAQMHNNRNSGSISRCRYKLPAIAGFVKY
ncbi:hypothetical protein [Vreelandella sedimenti]|uniref:hypothetical protein n=1 Tax=Vreelandella sedimenti TaxID=2729618 RepID=UPI00257AFF95|nr:hypothetical protein [Halomonas sp. UBA3173]